MSVFFTKTTHSTLACNAGLLVELLEHVVRAGDPRVSDDVRVSVGAGIADFSEEHRSRLLSVYETLKNLSNRVTDNVKVS